MCDGGYALFVEIRLCRRKVYRGLHLALGSLLVYRRKCRRTGDYNMRVEICWCRCKICECDGDYIVLTEMHLVFSQET